jgi:hypothetical protein
VDCNFLAPVILTSTLDAPFSSVGCSLACQKEIRIWSAFPVCVREVSCAGIVYIY